MKVLALNLGSTSSKIGIFLDGCCAAQTVIRHEKEALAAFHGLESQRAYRQALLEDWLKTQGYKPADFEVYALRCGLIRPVQGGIYRLGPAAVEDALGGKYGAHAANIGLLIGWDWSRKHAVPAIFVDAPVTDELSPQARVSGYAKVQRRSVFHALNMKRVARLYCAEQGLTPEEENLVVVHMGGGITVSAMQGLKAVDVTNGVDGEGPFSPERVGFLSHVDVLGLLSQEGDDKQALRAALYYRGGLQSYFGSNDVGALCRRGKTEPEVQLVLSAMLYQIAKSAGAMASVLQGRVRAVLLTGGIAHNKGLMADLTERLKWIAPVSVYPGEDELAALAEGAARFLRGEEEAQTLA